ncbi:MAG: NAD(P)H-binding protein [Actinobacteria bacterium]|nr:NAD(P)H-binding protein [Actinomycetota bacterium]MCA1721542.1 NAD(P)H-binding protein [Actinomycetota bacterium]
MSVVVVTGASGTLGSRLVPALRDAGYDVRGMTRKAGRVGAGEVVADVLDPASLRPALAGADLVFHLASNPRRHSPSEVDGTRNVLAAAESGHVVYLSIVGCDRTPFGYYRAKTAAEELVRGGGGTVVRATQFHSLVRTMLAPRLASRAIAPRGIRLQPVAEDFVVDVLVEAVLNPSSAPAEIAGPEQLDLDQLARRVTGHPPIALPLPLPLVKAVQAGSLLAGPGARTGGQPL